MLPVLSGRIQTRIFLLLIIGVPITFFFWWVLNFSLVPFFLLCISFFCGIGCDIFYNYAQCQTWDKDWPPAYFILGGIVEFFFTFFLYFLLSIIIDNQLLVPAIKSLPIALVLTHYFSILILSFLATQTIMLVLFPSWRFNGGKIWG